MFAPLLMAGENWLGRVHPKVSLNRWVKQFACGPFMMISRVYTPAVSCRLEHVYRSGNHLHSSYLDWKVHLDSKRLQDL